MQPTQHPEKFIVPIGPQHPALKEPGHFEFSVEGEIVTSASIRLGYVHRGIEKRTEAAILHSEPVPSRTHLRHLFAHPCHCLCPGVEKLAGVTAPPRAQANPRTLLPRWNGSTATCSGWVLLLTKPVSIPCSCIAGVIAKP